MRDAVRGGVKRPRDAAVHGITAEDGLGKSARFPHELNQFVLFPLVPAKAGTQFLGQELDARFRGHERGMGQCRRKTP